MKTAVKGNVKFIKPVETNRYEARIYAANTTFELNDFMSESGAIIYTESRRFGKLHNANNYKWEIKKHGEVIKVIQRDDFNKDKNRFHKDKNRFQKVIDKVNGKGEYKVFALNVYDHYGIVFNIREDKDSRWDNGCIGFIALPFVNNHWPVMTADDRNYVANYLTDLWEGYYEYRIYNNETEDFEWDDIICEYIHSGDCKEFMKNKEALEEKYGVDFEDAKVYH